MGTRLRWLGLALVLIVGLARSLTAEDIASPIVYKRVDGRDLKLFLFKPADWRAGDARPAVVFFHGGGWVNGKPSQFDRQAQYLATRGVMCLEVEYRLLGQMDKGPPLVCVHDARSAMRWVRSHAGHLGIHPKRIAAGGGSAGGHLAAFVGMVDGLDDPLDDLKVSPRADALLLFNPALDNGPEGAAGARFGERYREFSPAHHVSADDPPAIVFLGKADRLIPVSTIERFKSNMQRAGVRCEVRLYDDQPHGFFNREPFQTLTLIEADKFLASLGWIEGPPTLEAPAEDAVDKGGKRKGQAERSKARRPAG